MEVINRPGINERWLKGWKTTLRNGEDWFSSSYPSHLESLEHYVEHGAAKRSVSIAEYLEPLDPPEKSWEYLDPALRGFGALALWKWEKTGIEERRWDARDALNAFAGESLAELIGLYRFLLAPRRHIRPSSLNDLQRICFTALGLVTGLREAALRQARLQLAAYRRGYVQNTTFRPISAFVVRVLADYLAQEPIFFKGDPARLSKGEVAADPVMQNLFEAWRHPDPAALAPRCVAACDVHTHQAIPSTKDNRFEFGSGFWTRTPIAVLLVFHLRQSLGLENPRIEHPLMDSALGRLPGELAACEPDGIVQRVHARMRQDGFDEKEILASYQVA